MRINVYVASATSLSRRAADAAILAGRVRISGRPAVLGDTVEPGEIVTLDSSPIVPRVDHTYIVLNKPVGYVSSRSQQGLAPTVYKLLPAEYSHLRIAGRLDEASQGLLLLTDDGDAIQRFTHPSMGKIKTYRIVLSAPLSITATRALAEGVKLRDGLSRPRLVESRGQHLIVELSEGRNRQLRRTFGALGYEVRKLERTALGPFVLGDLPSGAWREATREELSA